MIKGSKASPETLRRMSEARKGHEVSLETRKKLAEAHRGKKRSEETKKKISRILLGNKRRLGKPHSVETKAKLAAWIRDEGFKEKVSNGLKRKWQDPKYRNKQHTSHLGKKQTKESKLKRSQKMKGRRISSGMLGKKHSEETKLKMSEKASKNRRERKSCKETYIEKEIRLFLESLGIEFEQEKYFRGIGAVDFYIESKNLVIECDGTYWHSTEKQKVKDKIKNFMLYERGKRVIRLSENEIRGMPQETKSYLLSFLV